MVFKLLPEGNDLRHLDKLHEKKWVFLNILHFNCLVSLPNSTNSSIVSLIQGLSHFVFRGTQMIPLCSSKHLLSEGDGGTTKLPTLTYKGIYKVASFLSMGLPGGKHEVLGCWQGMAALASPQPGCFVRQKEAWHKEGPGGTLAWS